MSPKTKDAVSEKIDHLFLTVRRDDGREFTYDDVEMGTNGRVSRSYVWKLRHGRNRNPSLDVVEAMARFFRVPPSYFFGPPLADDHTAREFAAVAALLEDDSARTVAEMSRGLSPKAMAALESIVEHLRDLDDGRAASAAPDRPLANEAA